MYLYRPLPLMQFSVTVSLLDDLPFSFLSRFRLFMSCAITIAMMRERLVYKEKSSRVANLDGGDGSGNA